MSKSPHQQTVTLGPIHPWLPGAMKIELGLRGDTIVSSKCTFGYTSKKIENRIVKMPALQAQWIFSRIEPESALLLDRLYSELLESISGIKIDERAVWIRDATTVICEINAHLKYLAAMAKVFGIPILWHIILKHREELLDLIELLTGSRYGYYYIQPGGTRYDLTEGFAERLEGWIRSYNADYARMESLFMWTHPAHNRLRTLGRVPDNGSFGFVSESSVESTRYGLISQVESRLAFVMNQAKELSDELHDMIGKGFSGGAPGKHLVQAEIKKGQGSAEIETSRGYWHLDLSIDAGLKIQSVAVKSPSDQILPAIPLALELEQIEDLPVILQSLNFLPTEIDR